MPRPRLYRLTSRHTNPRFCPGVPSPHLDALTRVGGPLTSTFLYCDPLPIPVTVVSVSVSVPVSVPLTLTARRDFYALVTRYLGAYTSPIFTLTQYIYT